jgi:two-component system response regulator FlrC
MPDVHPVDRARDARLARRLTQVLDALPAAVVLVDGKGRVDQYNPAAQSLFPSIGWGRRWAEVTAEAGLGRGAAGEGWRLADGRRLSLSSHGLGSDPGQLLVMVDADAGAGAGRRPGGGVARQAPACTVPAAGEVLVASDLRTVELRELARRVAGADVTVMINGESGTGKEVLARYIHRHSARSDGPFVAINCAAIPESLLEATLFGYEKGAFTGALRTTAGKFEQAQGGTLLLDEVSEMDLGLQAKLLRVLQEREVERVGGQEPIPLDVRVLATSNRNLREAVAAGRFREDLYYRLNVFPLLLPPLRDRPRDVLPLAAHLLARRCGAGGVAPGLSAEAADRLLAHRWPGNVRELDNVLQRALILQQGGTIAAADLCFDTEPATLREETSADTGPRGLSADLRTLEEQRILDTLRTAGGSRKTAAEVLGISPRTLRYKLARLREAGVAVPR